MRRTDNLTTLSTDCLEILRTSTYWNPNSLPRPVIGIPSVFYSKFSGSNPSPHEDCPHTVPTVCDKEIASCDRGSRLHVVTINAHIFNQLLPIIVSAYFYSIYLAKTLGNIDLNITKHEMIACSTADHSERLTPFLYISSSHTQ